jgi:hypothetical protein
MQQTRTAWFCGVVLLVMLATGCDQRRQVATIAVKPGGDDHSHGHGPHDGTIFDFGKYHAEFTVNHKTKEATVYILGGDAKTAVPIAVESLTLSIKAPAFQVELKAAPQPGDPMGKASRFTAIHDHFGKEQEFEGTLSGVLDGKPYAADFKEEPDHDHPAPAKK